MNERNLKVAEWSLGTAAVAFGAFNAFSDNIPTIKQRCREGDITKYLADQRSGYVAASIITAVTGLGVGLITRSAWPVLTAAGGAIGMVALFESHVPAPYRLLTGALLPDPTVIDGQYTILGGS